MRKTFEMTEAELAEILDACKPTPAMFLFGGEHMYNTPQENANLAWKRLGKKLGFDGMTARPTGSDKRFFSAEVSAEITE